MIAIARAELTAALGRVNAAYASIPNDRRPDVMGEPWEALERAIDDRCRAGDHGGAIAAIAAWEAHAMDVMGAPR